MINVFWFLKIIATFFVLIVFYFSFWLIKIFNFMEPNFVKLANKRVFEWIFDYVLGDFPPGYKQGAFINLIILVPLSICTVLIFLIWFVSVIKQIKSLV